MREDVRVTTETHGPTGPSRYVQRALARLRAFDKARPQLWDAALTAGWTLAALVDATDGWRNTARDPSVPHWLVLTTTLVLSLPLYWRRRRPTAALAAMACGALVSTVSGAFLQAAFLQALPVFHIALNRPPRALLWSAALIVPPLVTGAFLWQAESWDVYVVPNLWAYALVALLGITVRSRREEREQEVRLAAAAERARIAREMHDIIGHNLSVITGLADGGRYAAVRSPERAAQALDAIGTTSRQALGELRRLLGVLREDDESAARTPQPGLSDLPTLIEGVRKAGLKVRTDLAAPPGPARPGQEFSPGAELTVYRVVQEALTNTLKHGGSAAEATVTLAYAPEELVATVTDTGRGADAPSPGQGQGLAGMRERAALYDGTLECGTPPEGTGWRVRLTLPRTLPREGASS
ncbi:sensor histidine kinase [Streptomyces roseicoloratus]|uniref:sensor histidine kinase n=1 Tax=Streptomyces roseicoloratus TaxID=2508722 RepID=UPI001009DDE2|nr:histidine kinase [Streptomyces roseicoloratus]